MADKNIRSVWICETVWLLRLMQETNRNVIYSLMAPRSPDVDLNNLTLNNTAVGGNMNSFEISFVDFLEIR